MLWTEIVVNNKILLVGVIYRLPNSKVEYWDHFQLNIQQVIDTSLLFILLGDFNVNTLSDQSKLFRLLLQR
jgi:hypothetical protein